MRGGRPDRRRGTEPVRDKVKTCQPSERGVTIVTSTGIQKDLSPLPSRQKVVQGTKPGDCFIRVQRNPHRHQWSRLRRFLPLS